MTKPEGSMWSDDQWKAIAKSGSDILVAAAAGSGKTAVLVERIIRKITDESAGFSVDRLLVATFTKAAAAEMRERIREALERELENDPDNEHLRRQLALLGRASITTLHSFCMEVIRRYYQLIPLDPGFRILNEHEAELMRQDILEELFEEKYGDAEQGGTFLQLADWFSGERSDDALYRLVQRLYNFSRSHSWPDRWLRDTAAEFQVADTAALGETGWVQSILADARLALSGAAGLLEQARSVALLPGGPAPYAANLDEDRALVDSLLEAVNNDPWEQLYDRFRDVSFGKLKSVRKDEVVHELQERVKELRDNVKKTVNELKTALFGRPASEFMYELQTAAPLMSELVETVITFADRYRAAKAAKSTVDFNDLEHYCLQILRHPDSDPGHLMPSDAALEYREQFDEVLLDEYQDTNNVQEDIVRLISREFPGNRFMVGDVKQSIYRFRLAEPGLFLDKYKNYGSEAASGSENAEHLQGSSGIRIDLARNFRSRMEVVDAVNMLFRQIMNESVAEIAYDQRAELVCGASFPQSDVRNEDDVNAGPGQIDEYPYAPELLLIDRLGQESEEPKDEEGPDIEGISSETERLEMETAQLEARAIARRIREMTGENGKPLMVYDKQLKSMRPAQYGDMVILLRSAMVWAPLIMEELRQEGIPSFGEQNKGYFQSIEVEIMLSLLHVIDNPRQDIPLASVLRSPIVGLTEEELAQVRLCASGTFYDALSEAVSTFEPGLPQGVGIDTGRWFTGIELPGLAEVAAGLADFQQIREKSGISSDQSPVLSAELFGKLKKFMERLHSWRKEARQGSLSDLIWRIYSDTGYLDWIGGLPGGTQRRGNLTALYDRAVQYEQDTSSRGLFRFLKFISRLRDNGGDLGAAGGTESQGNAVRLMTIHKSKGLEFPVVFVAGISKNFNQQDLNVPFLMHKELGFGPKYVDEKLRVSYPTLPNLAIRRRSQLELLAEEMRVLYVALTRPKEKMILVGTVKDLPKKVSGWAQADSTLDLLLPDYMLARGRSYLDWIGPAIIRHPSAGVLREAAGLQSLEHTVLSSDSTGWIIHMETSDSLSGNTIVKDEQEVPEAERAEKELALRKLEPVADIGWNEKGSVQEMRQEIYRRLSWSYPFAAVSGISAKTSVTEMKKLLAMQDSPSLDMIEEAAIRRQQEETQVDASSFTLHLRRPKFMEAVTLTPAERGTVYHTVMQHLPISNSTDLSVVERTIAELTEKEIITRAQAEAVSPEHILGILHSSVGVKLLEAQQVWREMPFSYGLSASEAYKGLSFLGLAEGTDESSIRDAQLLDDETVLIQGIVDCLFRFNDKLILLDYKTDRVVEHRGGIETLTEHYRFQLELYSKALQDILGEPIHEKWLYFFDGGRAVLL
ncbi:helicase-exonuclease AddAB subunit AddA [Paenibacillus sp. N3/727]|uniref:helicase-exonuclease AddAB subunit AddA n=1 Tax=Paenibacillus sp. N3/727 TaxID=2925845 RepID=UPI001F534DE4|nr:helicase-exonuclease AddAB subunit AddA [Paenibacillus sp. N3/727]UNK21223.1 helicase-exonuclease AddAB subunit AddA [Paenibacillus sp. N3/727]